MFRLGYRHCFTVDENLICATKRKHDRTWTSIGGRGQGQKEETVYRKKKDRQGRVTKRKIAVSEVGVVEKGESGGSDGCCLV